MEQNRLNFQNPREKKMWDKQNQNWMNNNDKYVETIGEISEHTLNNVLYQINVEVRKGKKD